MQQIGIVGRGGVSAPQASLLKRFAAKIAIDVVPAALASLAVGCLLSQYHAAPAPAPAVQTGAASAEVMQLVRDEHAAIVDYLQAQTAAEQRRYAADDAATARAVANAKATVDVQTADARAATTQATRRVAAAVVAPELVIRSRAVRDTAAAPQPPIQAPLIIAQADDSAVVAPPPAPTSDSLLARTIAVKDHVVHATFHIVSTIGGIPNWIASLGDRIAGAPTTAPEEAKQFTSS